MARPKVFYFVLGLSVLALSLQIVGFILPSWVHMKRSVPKVAAEMLFISTSSFSTSMRMFGDDMVFPPKPEDMDGDMKMPMDPRAEGSSSEDSHEMDDGRRHHGGDRPSHHGGGGHHPPHHGGDRPPHHGGSEMEDDDEKDEFWGNMDDRKADMMGDLGRMPQKQENFEIPTAQEMLILDPNHSTQISVSYGLWFSKFCQHDVTKKRDRRDADKDDKKDGKKHKKHCKCKVMDTKEALMLAPLFEDIREVAKDKKCMLTKNNLGNAPLTEHRVEATLAIVFAALGLVAGVLGTKSQDACRCFVLTCSVAMLLSTVLIVVPAARFGAYTAHRRHQAKDSGVDVHCPISALLAAAGGVATFVCFIVAIVAFAQKKTKQARQWYQFSNEVEKEKKPYDLYQVAEPLPVKVDLSFAPTVYEYEIKPEVPEPDAEPEKTPLE